MYPHDNTQKVAIKEGFLFEMKIPSPVPICMIHNMYLTSDSSAWISAIILANS
jgi:hypothetical protein